MSQPDPELGEASAPVQPDENGSFKHFSNVVRVVMLARNWLLSVHERSPDLDQIQRQKENLDAVFALQPVASNCIEPPRNRLPVELSSTQFESTTKDTVVSCEGTTASVDDTIAYDNDAYSVEEEKKEESLQAGNHTANNITNNANGDTKTNNNSPVVLSAITPSNPLAVARPPFVKRFKNYADKLWKTIKSAPTDTVDPAKGPYYYWTFVVYIAFLYNCLMCVMFVFDDMQGEFFKYWFAFNMVFDGVYWMDMFINSKLNHIEDGMKVRGWKRLLKRYVKSFRFACDLLSSLPTDFILLWNRKYSICRANRLLKFYRVLDFVERTNIRTNYPNGFRIFHIMVTCAVIFHLNAALYFKVSLITGIESTNFGAWEFNYVKNQDVLMSSCNMLDPDDHCGVTETEDDISYRQDELLKYTTYWNQHLEPLLFSNFAKQYSLSIYWSSLTLTTSGQQPFPTATAHNLLEIVDTISGVLVFAVIVGSVGNVVVTMNKARAEYQNLMDGIKFYMNYRQVASDIQSRVMDCVEYIHKNSSFQDESEILSAVPRRLQGELAVHLHMESLKSVELLQECEPSLLYEFVMHLTMQMYGPNDYLCRVGDVAKEMYIVKQGTLETISGNGDTVAVLREGDTFGELSLLKISAKAKTNRRQRSLRSVGYTDVYHLRQEDVINILRDYPESRERMIRKAKEIIKKKTKITGDLDDPETLSQQLEGVNTIEDSLSLLRSTIESIDVALSDFYDNFKINASDSKKRVTNLEKLYREKYQRS
ncbi:unnamed protein product [Bursaphelenchus xylophilus]|uniref:(pine wood nematode) hypothetical protein n=1 Tax=Bursaphelenchus xylophilus TaxID=6326 RepID=A0A1I7S3F8_BURXY|nr:unnamed protein product [Bursaphelenchus xylophilus]CAG9116279.1 unnamed protein product [Bursaphelenchus xylophilus]